MNLVTVYGIYGDDLGIQIYKYFDFHSLVSSILAQVLIMAFGTEYVAALWFFMIISVAGYFLTDRIDFTAWGNRNRTTSDSLVIGA
jgi:uncharacterized membrane protein